MSARASRLETLLTASVELIELRGQVKALQIENARLRATVDRLTDFDLSADSVPVLCKPQA